MFILHLQDRTASNIKLLYLKQLASRKAKPLWIINLCIWFLTVFRVRSQHWNVVVSARPLFLACGFGCLVSCIFCVFIHYCNCPTPRRPFGALHQVSNIHTVPQYWIGLSLLWILPLLQTLNSSSYLTAPVLKLLAVCSYLCVTLFNAVYFCVEVQALSCGCVNVSLKLWWTGKLGVHLQPSVWSKVSCCHQVWLHQ